MNAKIIISFFFGAGAGFGGCYLFLKKHFEKKMADEINQMHEYAYECKKYGHEMKKYADDMYELATGKEAPKEGFTDEEIKNYLKKDSKINRRLEEKEIINIEEAYDDIQEAVAEKERNDYTQSLTDYTQYSKDKSAYEHPNDEPGIPRIELITAEEYDLTPPLYSKVILSYYEDDDILCYEESNEIVENPEALIGVEALHAFGSPDYEDPNEIFVRNNQNGCDYQVILYEGSYQEMFGDIYMG